MACMDQQHLNAGENLGIIVHDENARHCTFSSTRSDTRIGTPDFFMCPHEYNNYDAKVT
jgi:hypothetical protein